MSRLASAAQPAQSADTNGEHAEAIAPNCSDLHRGDSPPEDNSVTANGLNERQLLAVGDVKFCGEPLLFEVRSGQIDGGRGQIDTGDARPATREAREIDAGAASHLQD